MATNPGYVDYDDPRYTEVCKTLGVDPSIRFVRLTTRGTIGFTLGKPEELRWLLRRCEETGLRPSRGLRETVRARC